MIDLHCHILPEIDDGAESLFESVTMARMAASDGIMAVVATPHTCNGVFSTFKDSITRRVDNLNVALIRAAIPLKVFAGAEVRLVPGLPELLLNGEASTINNSRYVLLELPKVFMVESVKEEMFSLRMNGYIPVLAHPERHSKFERDFDSLKEFIAMGALCQVTGVSLTGGFGREIKFVAEKMVVQRMAHVLATDSHGAAWREPILSASVKRVARLLGNEEEAKRMVFDVPQAIIANRDISIEIPGEVAGQQNTDTKPGKVSRVGGMFSSNN